MLANDSRVAAIENEIAHLRGLGLDGLRASWRSLTGRVAPSHLPKTLLLRVLAYRVQAAALGDLDKATARLLDRIADGLVEARAARVVVRAGSILIHPSTEASEPIEIAWLPPAQRRGREILATANGSAGHDCGIKAEARMVLLRSIALGRRWRDQVLAGTSMDEIAAREGCTKQHVANAIPLAFLAPEVVRAVIDARLPRGISARRIAQPELEWVRQWEMLGIRS